MSSILITLSFLGCVSSGAMLSMLLLLVVAYLSASIWLISHGVIYTGLLYVLVYVGAIVVLIMFVVQLTNTSLNDVLNSNNNSTIFIQNLVLLLSIIFLIKSGSNITFYNILLDLTRINTDLNFNNTNNILSSLILNYTLPNLANQIYNEYGYILVISIHAIVLAVIGPIKLALSDYKKT